MTRKLAAIAALVAVALVAAWYLALWKPAGKHLAQADQQLSSAQDGQTAALGKRAALQHQQKGLPAVVSEARLLDQAAPTSAAIPDLIDQVSSIATKTGVSWHSESQTQVASGAAQSGSVQPASSGSATTPAGVQSFSLTLSVTGTYAQILQFVTDLQAAPRLVKVGQFQLSAGSPSVAGSGSSAGSPSGPQSGSVGGIGSAGSSSMITTSLSATVFEAPAALPKPPAPAK